MGFNKKILPQIEEMEKLYEEDPDGYIEGLIKIDALIGPMGSIDWVNKKIREYNERDVKK